MKLNSLFDYLETKGLDVNGNSVVYKARPDYSIAIEFGDDYIIEITNNYNNKSENLNYPKRYVVFSGRCTGSTALRSILNIVNIEDATREKLLNKLN